ncbi:MAG: glycogen debranching protein GlgX [Pseudomonadota bacterium]
MKVAGPGRPRPLGLTLEPGGANIAVRAGAAERVHLCLFDAAGAETRLPLPDRTGDIHHAWIEGVAEGQRYGLRAEGPGAAFDPRKLLADPCAPRFDAPFRWDDRLAAGDPRDSAPAMPKAVAAPLPTPIDPAERPAIPWSRTVIYEAHAKGLTRLDPEIPEAIRGTYDALGHPVVIARLQRLGVTALELLPVMAFMDEPRLLRLGLSNYWGYNTAAFLAPEPRYVGPSGPDGLRAAVRALHQAGIEVILDVVFNHTAELDAQGPTLSLRGLDDRAYYRRAENAPEDDPTGGYVNWTGCGNTLDFGRPEARELALTALRFWAERIGVDGFRFDLAAILARGPDGAFDPAHPFLEALAADPVLSPLKLIMEPWDIGPDGWKTGAFPAPFAEWNDGFRDCVRRAWRGDARGAQDLAGALLGSAQRFDRGARPAWSSVNFVAAHDGFTLADQTLYARRRNDANGEQGRDGHAHEVSDPMGPEGPSQDPAQQNARARRRRALIATVLLSQGTPMLRAGDEIGQSQGGNNNAYNQDNATSWIDWAAGDDDLAAFTAAAIAARRRLPVLAQRRFLHGALRADGRPELAWHALDGAETPDWDDPALPGFLLTLRGAAGAAGPDPRPALLAVNLGAAPAVPTLPGPETWRTVLDSAAPRGDAGDDPALAPGAIRLWEAA